MNLREIQRVVEEKLLFYNIIINVIVLLWLTLFTVSVDTCK